MARRVLRLLFVLLLAVSVPLKAFAAASAAPCDEHSHAVAQAADHGPAPGDSHGKSHDCAPCGASAAIAASARLFAPERAAFSSPSAPACRFYGVTLARLDRPPLAP